jgi:hypothetical protein
VRTYDLFPFRRFTLFGGISANSVQYFGAIEGLDSRRQTCNCMARYSAFLGRRVEVQYRAGDILLPASGTFVADSGRSIFLEQHLEQRGQMKQFRWEIPYQYIVRLEEREEPSETSGTGDVRSGAAAGTTESRLSDKKSGARGSPDSASNDPQAILPLRNRPKPA